MSNYNFSRQVLLRKKRMRKKYKALRDDDRLKKTAYFTKRDSKLILTAMKIFRFPYRQSSTGDTVKYESLSIWDDFMSCRADVKTIDIMKCFFSILRKADADNFPIENYYLFEVPCSYIFYFVEKNDADNYHWLKENNDIRAIAFDCSPERLIATPCREVIDEGRGIRLVDVRTCQDAVFSNDE